MNRHYIITFSSTCHIHYRRPRRHTKFRLPFSYSVCKCPHKMHAYFNLKTIVPIFARLQPQHDAVPVSSPVRTAAACRSAANATATRTARTDPMSTIARRPAAVARASSSVAVASACRTRRSAMGLPSATIDPMRPIAVSICFCTIVPYFANAPENIDIKQHLNGENKTIPKNSR